MHTATEQFLLRVGFVGVSIGVNAQEMEKEHQLVLLQSIHQCDVLLR